MWPERRSYSSATALNLAWLQVASGVLYSSGASLYAAKRRRHGTRLQHLSAELFVKIRVVENEPITGCQCVDGSG